jgi:hypothetical protein
MFNPWFALSLKTVQMGTEAQSVIALRVLRMAAGGARAEAEAQPARHKLPRRQLSCAATKSMSSRARRSTSIASAFAPINGAFLADSHERLQVIYSGIEKLRTRASPQ